MKHTIKILAALAVLGLAMNANKAFAQVNVGSMSVHYIQPVGISAGPNEVSPGEGDPNRALNFGNLIPSPGTVTMDNSGNLDFSADAGAQPPASHTGNPGRQTWEVTGEPGWGFNLTSPSAITSVGWPSGMTFTPNDLSAGNPYTLNGSGKHFFGEGGVLVIPNAGVSTDVTYTATWTMDVTYN